MRQCITAALAAMMMAGCRGEPARTDNGEKPPAPLTPALTTGEAGKAATTPAAGKSLLVTQSTFKQNDAGKYVVPDAAELLIVTPRGNAWNVERIRDEESNVFHKAFAFGDKSIITIGANEARLKMWKKDGAEWRSETLWGTTFGGKHNRLRDMEMADFNGDGKPDLAIATHDQGVVAVAWNEGDSWRIEELDRKPDTFVHEIEIGDLDGDGKLEIYSTPSDPNTSSGHKQGGEVIRYSWTGEKFERSVVASFDHRHIKEILVADVDGDGKQELYAVLEAQMGPNLEIEVPVEIHRYDYDKDKKAFSGQRIVQIPDRFCRFLTAGDINHNGRVDLVAAAFSSGIHLIEKNGDEWTSTVIDKDSGGFEHAAWMTDLDGDGKLELYVADDKNGILRRYVYNGAGFDKTDIHRRLVPSQAMVWNITTAP